MLLHFAGNSDGCIGSVMNAAFLTHFVATLTVCPRIRSTLSTLYFFMPGPHDKMIAAFVALMPMKWTIHPLLHLIKLCLLRLSKGTDWKEI